MTTNKVNPSTLSGFMELLPSEQLKFNKIEKVLREVYELYGFYPLDTPILEKSEVLLAKAGGETEAQIYRFLKGETDITMRFDLTVPLAKYVAKNYNEIVFPFKRYQIGKVYRGERAQRGRFREFYQADIDIIGDSELNIVNDAEIPSIIYNVFNKLGLTDFTIRINNRKILSGFFKMLKLDDKATDVMRVVDKIEKISKEEFINELKELKVSEEACNKILEFIYIKGDNEEIINSLKNFSGSNEMFDEGINELELINKSIANFNVPKENYKIDLSIARGLDYYTGTVYETTFNKHPEIGSICSGGRYDNLAEYYTDKKLPGVGISIGLTRLFYILNEMEYLNNIGRGPADVLIIPMTDDLSYAINISSEFINENIKTQIYFENKKFKNKISYANKNKINYVIFLGEDEITQKKVAIKNLESGEQTTLDLNDAIELVKKSLNEINTKTSINTEKTKISK
ncbi:MAG: histidine--tRNA ligase [Bacilli bacterium]|nr:histidine--tRNA ligase [Bacilli bacterium]MDD4718353.1 histidine--tRNA ligase [Bacilli bacterium]